MEKKILQCKNVVKIPFRYFKIRNSVASVTYVNSEDTLVFHLLLNTALTRIGPFNMVQNNNLLRVRMVVNAANHQVFSLFAVKTLTFINRQLIKLSVRRHC